MVNVLDENGVRQLAQGIKDNCKEWVKDKRRRQQIIIGKAIKLTPYYNDKENWYVSNKNIYIKVPKRILDDDPEFNTEKVVVYIDGHVVNYRWDKIERADNKGGNNITLASEELNDPPRMLCVEKYEYYKKKLHIWLSKKPCPPTISGTSLNKRLVMGKIVYKEKPPVSLLFEVLNELLQKGSCRKYVEVRRIRKERKTTKDNSGNRVCYGFKKRSERIYVFGFTPHVNRIKSGVYKIRYLEGPSYKSKKTEWTFAYVRKGIKFVYVEGIK